jgi:hypothetical protein
MYVYKTLKGQIIIQQQKKLRRARSTESHNNRFGRDPTESNTVGWAMA